MCNLMDIYLTLIDLLSCYWSDEIHFLLFIGSISVYLDLKQFPKTNFGTECPHSLSTEVRMGRVFLPPSSVWVAENYWRVGFEGGCEGHPLFLLKKGLFLQKSQDEVFFPSGEGKSFWMYVDGRLPALWPSFLPDSPSFRKALWLKS